MITQFDPGTRAPGNKSAFARRIGLTTRSLDRWLDRQVNVSIESVLTVAKALGMPQEEQVALLSRIGYFADPQAPPLPPAPQDPREDPIIQRILTDPQWTEAQRVELVRMQLDRIEQDLERRRLEYEWLIRQHQQDRGVS